MRNALFAAAALTLAATAAAQARDITVTPAPLRPAGTLTCSIDPGLGLILGSTRQVHCTFERFDRATSEIYTGQLSRVGVDVGLTSGQTIAWTIATPAGRTRPGMLNGSFNGSSIDATVLVGPGMQTTFGDRAERIAIERTLNSGQAGLGFGLGATGMTLVATGLVAQR